MDRQALIDRLLDHNDQPRNYGPLDPVDLVAPGGQPDCADLVTLYLRFDPTGLLLERLTFIGQGCTISQAAASILTEIVAGKPIAELELFDSNQMIDLLGREVVGTRPICATLALNTLKAALLQHRQKRLRAAL